MGAVVEVPRPMSRRRRAALAAVSVLLLGLSMGCAGSEPPPVPPPPGPSETSEAPPRESRPGHFEGPSYAFDHPPRWKVVDEPTVSGVDFQMVEAGGAPGSAPTVTVASERGFRGSFESGVNLFELGPISGVPDRKVLARRPVRVDGAREALLIDQRYTQYVRDGRAVSPDEVRSGDEPTTARQWTILALSPEGVAINMAMGAPNDEFRANRPEFQRIVDSLALRP